MTLPGNYSWKSQVMICWKIGYTRNVQSWATYSSQRDGNHYRDMKCNWSSLRVHVRYMNSDVHEFFRASETSLKVTASYYISVKVSSKCVACTYTVHCNQHAIACDVCSEWTLKRKGEFFPKVNFCCTAAMQNHIFKNLLAKTSRARLDTFPL